jgi:uncharacterized protein (TIGR02453 family)
MAFPGFPPDALKFFRGLKRNNHRDWFQPRKEIFESKVKAPMIQLVESINAALEKFAPDYMNDPKKAVYRIYRDLRFSADKSPYKTHLAAIFPKRGGERGSTPGFYFHISAKQIAIAGGLYEPQPDQLYAVRSWLAENHAKFLKVVKTVEKTMGPMQGESLRRIPKGFDAAHPAAELLKKKQWVFYASLPAVLATSPKFEAELIQRFKALLPVMELLNTAVSSAKKRAAAADFTSDFM